MESVSIHAPWEGCDQRSRLIRLFGGKVSIHAPWEGCDDAVTPRLILPRGFNSRTLGRVRLPSASSSSSSRRFQFTHPGKGATARAYTSLQGYMFQFTHPGKGATASCSRSRWWLKSFNSRTLGRVRRDATQEARLSLCSFQFTHPGKGATDILTAIQTMLSCFNSRTLGRVRQHRCIGANPIE